ncbi:MAG: M56 family metallopeptidase [Mangrovibacterium sp.]
MAEYIIKSTISLTVLYVLYYSLLRNIKSFEFNRFYLLFVVMFSLIIPFIQIPMGIDLLINQNTQDYSSSISNINIKGAIVKGQKESVFHLIDLLIVVYILISAILLIRFVFNLWNIIKLINKSSKDLNSYPRIVLSQQKTLPYSFFQYIIVSKTEYEKGQIDYDLIIHEQAHCNQHHSVDILFIEIVKIIFWFNPIIWILKKEMQLNHEYLADSKVLKTQNLKSYQYILLNLVFRNNSTYLASNFNYSFTKKRLIMMTKNISSTKSMVRKITIVPLVLILAVSLTFSQENLSKESLKNFDKEWWYPIIEKHKIEPQAFNNFENVFEMGSSNSIENGIVTLTDALFIIRENYGYMILKSPLAYHDLDKNTISADEGVVETFKDNSPSMIISYKKFIFKLQKDKSIAMTAKEMRAEKKKK